MITLFHYRRAVHLLLAGGILAHPTEAVYGLACDPLNGAAVMRLLALKQRLPDKGLILIAAHLAQLHPWVRLCATEIPEPVLASWPGPHTWLLPAAPAAPGWITGGRGRERIAVRITAHPVAAELCRRFGGPLVSTSANVSGRPPARTPLQARLRCPGVDQVLHGPTGGLETPTPIRDALTGEIIRS